MKKNQYTPESVARAELKKAVRAWESANPEDVQAVKSAYGAKRQAEQNLREILRMKK
jgi:hypothetical protein